MNLGLGKPLLKNSKLPKPKSPPLSVLADSGNVDLLLLLTPLPLLCNYFTLVRYTNAVLTTYMDELL